MSGTIADAIERLSWGTRGALLAVACVLATLVSPVLGYSCRSGDGGVSCRVTRHAFGVIPFWWTTIAPVDDARSDFRPGGRTRDQGEGWALTPSRVTNEIRARGEDWHGWTTYASIGADPGSIAIAIDELVASGRTEPFLAWQSNGAVDLAVFILALPFAAAMLSRPYCERHVARDRWLSVIERTYVVTLAIGTVLAAALYWGKVPG